MEGLTNVLPYIFYLGHDHIARFYLFKWVYQYGQYSRIPYQEIRMDEQYRSLQRELARLGQTIDSTSFVLDPLTFYYLINDIKYFSCLYMLTKEDITCIQNDLYDILDEMEWICKNGCFRRTGKEVFFYVSNTNFPSNYSYLQIGSKMISLIKVFLLNDLTSTRYEAFKQTQAWVQSQKRYATLISQSGARFRMLYFQHQRELVDSLTNDRINTDEFLFKCDYASYI